MEEGSPADPEGRSEPGDGDDPHIESLLAPHAVLMLTTMVGRHHSSRPVVCAAADGDRLSFLARRDTDWVRAVEGREAIVHLTSSDGEGSRYLSLNGTARTEHDRSLVRSLWSAPLHEQWFTADDERVVAVHFDVTDGECWTDQDPSGRPFKVAGTVVAPRSRTVE